MIIDEVKIQIKAGDGGQGSFSSLKLSSRRIIGGGGDGGKGGNVIFRVSPHLSDLSKFADNKKFIAEDGAKGDKNNRKGKNGLDCIIPVPSGTMVLDTNGELVIDLNSIGQEYLICKGGAAGKGNYKRLSSIPPEKGQEKEVILYYAIPNDVVIVGFPNCGKTSLFNKLTGKSYKVADYPFTTKACVWSPVEIDSKKFTLLDTPPLKNKIQDLYVEHSFLRHILRSKVILILSDNYLNYKEEISLIKERIRAFSEQLWEGKKVFYLLTKIDKIDKAMPINLKGIMPISVEADIGIEQLKRKILKQLQVTSRKLQD
jgi:GTP-binding protein